MSKAEVLFEQAFSRPRTPRSDAYKAGVRAILRVRLDETPQIALDCPYIIGTADADAWFAGIDEGHAIYRTATANERQVTASPRATHQRPPTEPTEDRLT